MNKGQMVLMVFQYQNFYLSLLIEKRDYMYNEKEIREQIWNDLINNGFNL